MCYSCVTLIHALLHERFDMSSWRASIIMNPTPDQCNWSDPDDPAEEDTQRDEFQVALKHAGWHDNGVPGWVSPDNKRRVDLSPAGGKFAALWWEKRNRRPTCLTVGVVDSGFFLDVLSRSPNHQP